MGVDRRINRRVCIVCGEEKNLDDFHADKSKLQGRRYDCKVCNNKKRKRHYEENKKQHSENGKIYYQKNKDHIKKRTREYYHANSKEINKARRHRCIKRRVQRKNNGVFTVLKKDLDKIYLSECLQCGSRGNIHIDHVIPISRGGVHSVGNIQPLCASCNMSKSNKYMIEWRAVNDLSDKYQQIKHANA